jgi:hypothetical protein
MSFSTCSLFLGSHISYVLRLACSTFLRLWPHINHNSSLRTLVSRHWFRPWCSVSRLKCAAIVRIYFLFQASPQKNSRARKGQETWMAKRCCPNLERCVRYAWLSNSPLIRLLRVLWHRLTENTAQRSRRQHPLLTPLSIGRYRGEVRSLCSWLYCIPWKPLKRCIF